MTVSTSTVQDILESAAAIIVGGSAPTGTGAPTGWRQWTGSDLSAASDRHFEIYVDSIEDTANTGRNVGQTTDVDRKMSFGVRLKWVMEGRVPKSKHHGQASRDAISIRDRVKRHLREHDTAYASSGGALVSTALNGVRTVEDDAALRFDAGDVPAILIVTIPLRVWFTDTQVYL